MLGLWTVMPTTSTRWSTKINDVISLYFFLQRLHCSKYIFVITVCCWSVPAAGWKWTHCCGIQGWLSCPCSPAQLRADVGVLENMAATTRRIHRTKVKQSRGVSHFTTFCHIVYKFYNICIWSNYSYKNHKCHQKIEFVSGCWTLSTELHSYAHL